ncbi:OSJNBa0042F21.10 protein, related [Eimeria mitis]|uniref:OSJNBa0042F21.10 protein, related n=1 Tax=Eimeria mitis TaxID=44415 RepID=U6KB59_9EIME|nr:OSJNBa0042F21.10 protein, related [Eimeria mitis]CDJ35189.1 OSJNBa0042F21.10 protein, related [Eimeria mitis]
MHQRTPAEQAYDILAKQVADMTREEATALLRPPSKRYKSPTKGKRKAVVAALIQQATESTSCIRHPLQGLYAILTLPAMEWNVALRLVEEWQGALCCALAETAPPNIQKQCLKAPPATELPDDEETSSWATAKLEYSQLDTWLKSEEAKATPRAILDVLCAHRAVFPDKLRTGLPAKRPHDHRILLLPGKLPTNSAIYRMTPEQLQYHKQEIAKLTANGWIGPTYSPICAPTIMVDKRDDGTGERKMRMVVNYQELNALTIASDFPLPPVQTILEMLGGARYFSTLDLESGFHQIRMAREDRWNTAFRSVMKLFEYKVMPFGLKGAPATFQANISAYLQPLLGQGVVAYLDDVLIYSPDLPSHVALLQQVLRIFLDQQFYPKFRKCKFSKQELTYLGYTISAEGIKPAEDKIKAIQSWPKVLANDMQVRQFLGTANCFRMFMGPDYAKVARQLVDLTHKGAPFQWTDLHTQAVQRLKRRLIDYTTLQVPDATKPFELYTDASGYAIGAVLEQPGQPIGFLSQVMSPTQQRYSTYDQELLALVTALDKWAHLLRVSKVTAHADHQALTHLQQLRASKPLRGRTARWLDFLAEFPHLTITYLPGARNQVADALSRLACHSTPTPDTTPIGPSLSPPGSLAALTVPTDTAAPPHKTRGRLANYRELAGLRTRTPRKPSNPPPATATSPTPSQPHARPAPETPAAAHPPPTLDWVAAYPKCPVFSAPYQLASSQPGAVIQQEFQHRRYSFRYVPPYLHICINDLWLICVPQFPELLTHVV